MLANHPIANWKQNSSSGGAIECVTDFPTTFWRFSDLFLDRTTATRNLFVLYNKKAKKKTKKKCNVDDIRVCPLINHSTNQSKCVYNSAYHKGKIEFYFLHQYILPAVRVFIKPLFNSTVLVFHHRSSWQPLLHRKSLVYVYKDQQRD